MVVQFDGKRFPSVDDFFQKAAIRGEHLTTLYEELSDFSLARGGKYGTHQKQ